MFGELSMEDWDKASKRVRNSIDEDAMASPLDHQVGGGHYKTLGIQPFEITFKNFGYHGLRAAVYNKVNKYLSRDKGSFEKHIEDVEKAIHCLQVQLEYARKTE